MPKQIDEDKLFEATVEVFAECGYQAATTLEIARRSGVSEVTLFRRYGGKAALINAALAHTLARSPFAQTEVTDDVAADLVAMLRGYAETTQRYGGAALSLLTDVPRHPELRVAMDALMPNLVSAAQLIAAHQQRGRLAPGEPMQLLMTLLAPVMVHGLWSRTGASPIVAYDPRALVEAFLDGHGRDGGRGRDLKRARVAA
jgi:AcrR family transcriptional regulator